MPSFEMNSAAVTRLSEFLRANRKGEKYFVAATTSLEVASLIIQTGETAVSLGGFMGADAVMTKDEFVDLVSNGQLRFVIAGGGPGGGLPPLGPGGPGGLPFGPAGGAPLGGPMAGPQVTGGQIPNGVGGPPGPGGPFGMGNSEIMTWVRENGRLVDPELWRPAEKNAKDQPAPAAPFGPMGGARQLYDLRPHAGWIEVSADESGARQRSEHAFVTTKNRGAIQRE